MNNVLDYFGRKETPTLTLCRPNFTPVGSLASAYNPVTTMRFSSISELKFDFPKSTDNYQNSFDEYPKLQPKMVVKVENIGNFIIESCPEDSTGSVPVKHVTAQSIESELLYKRITSLQGTFKFSDRQQLSNTIMGRVLKLIPGWALGYVDPELEALYRTFDVGDTTIYSFLTNDVATAFNAVFIFDKFSKVISARLIKNLEDDSKVFFSFSNANLNATTTEFSDELATVLACYGGGDLDIRRVNPLGGNTIYNFDHYIKDDAQSWMSESLKTALTNWKAKVKSKEEDYKDITYKKNLELEKYVGVNQRLADTKSELVALQTTLEGMKAAKNGEFTPEEIAQAELNIVNQKIIIRLLRAERAKHQGTIDEHTGQLRNITHALKFTNLEVWEDFKADLDSIIEQVNNLSADWKNVYFDNADELELTPEQLTESSPRISSISDSARGFLTTLQSDVSRKIGVYWSLLEHEKRGTISIINQTVSVLTSLYDELNALISNTDLVISLYSSIIRLQSYTGILANESNLTEEENIELQNYMFYNTYTNANIISTDIMTEKDLQEQSQILYDQAIDVLERVSKPRFEFTGNFVNILDLPEFSEMVENIELGKQLTIETSPGTVIEKIALLEISYSYDNPESFTMTFSNRVKLNDSNFKFADMFLNMGGGASGLSGITSSNTDRATTSSTGVSQGYVSQNPNDTIDVQPNIIQSEHVVITKKGSTALGPTPPTEYGNYVGAFLGYDNGAKMSLYSNEGSYLKWDGQKLLVKARNFTLDSQGNITANDADLSGKITALSGEIGGWVIGTDSLYSSDGKVHLNSQAPKITLGDTIDFNFGTGVFLGKDESDDIYKLRVGNPNQDYMSWDGSNLSLTGYVRSTDQPFDLELMKMSFQSISWAQFAIFDDFENTSRRRIPDTSLNKAMVTQGTLTNGGDKTANREFGFKTKLYNDITTVAMGTTDSVGTNFMMDADGDWFDGQYKGYLIKDYVGKTLTITECEPGIIRFNGTISPGPYQIISKLPTTTVLFCSFDDSSNGHFGNVKVELSFDNEAHFQTIIDTENGINNSGGMVSITNPGRTYSARFTLKNDSQGRGPTIYKFLACTDPSVWS